jgi:RNA-directed DNA polymerase
VKPEDTRPERSDGPAPDDTTAHPAEASLWELVFSRGNLAAALRRVDQNAGAAGIDGMSTKELRSWLHRHWPQVRSALDAGTYRPQPVRRVMIPKPSGGERMLGVPTVLDRLIQQAVLQVLTPVFDPHFHPHSFGFRPGRSAHEAVERARQSIADGAVWCVDLDLDSFFDRVGHDALMARVARLVADKQVLRLIRRYLEAGVMADGIRQPSEEGTPQGSPLSPLLSNVMLDDLDSELDRGESGAYPIASVGPAQVRRRRHFSTFQRRKARKETLPVCSLSRTTRSQTQGALDSRATNRKPLSGTEMLPEHRRAVVMCLVASVMRL